MPFLGCRDCPTDISNSRAVLLVWEALVFAGVHVSNTHKTLRAL